MKKVKQCPDDKILNPDSNHCVGITGSVGKALVKKVKANQVKLQEEDLQKLLQKKLITKDNINEHTILQVQIKTNKKPQADPPKPDKDEKIPIISDKIRKRLKDILEYQRQRKKMSYLDESHQKYCETNKNQLLSQPIVAKTTTTTFSMYTIKHNFVNILDNNINFSTILKPGEPISMNNYNKSISLKLYDPANEEIINKDWFNESNQYIKSLSNRDLLTVMGYTYHGDVWANNYMRNKLSEYQFKTGINNLYEFWISYYMPLFFQALDIINNTTNPVDVITQNESVHIVERHIGNIPINNAFLKKNITVVEIIELLKNKTIANSSKYLAMGHIARYFKMSFWESCIELYCKDLDRIIKHAPLLKRKMIVFRGVKDDYYLKGSKKSFYKNQGFISSSVYYNKASSFAKYINIGNKQGVCCLKRITLLPGTRCLFVSGLSKFPDEFEVLLPSNSVYYLKNAKSTYKMYKSEYLKETDICGNIPTNMHYVQVTDVVLVK